MSLAAKQTQLIVPSRRIITPRRRQLYRAAIPGIAPLPMRGRAPIVPGTVGYGTGTHNFILPNCNTLTIDLYAPGGGGGGVGGYYNGPLQATPGSSGGYVRAYYYGSGIAFDLVAYGGNGGPATYANLGGPLSGSHGTATGGNLVNTTGGGAAGGLYGQIGDRVNHSYGSYGGYGARCASTITGLGAYQGALITVIVGAPGAAGANNPGPFAIVEQNPTGGNGGAAYFSWS